MIPSAGAGLSEAEAIAAVKSELGKHVADDKFSGAVLIAKDGKPIFQAAYGYADRENKVTNTVDTKFRFGSMAKMFTSVTVLQLAQAGKIKLDDPVAKYLPDYPNKQVAAVTINQLLTHTGGTGDIFSPEFEAHRQELKELRDYVALFGNRGVKFKPGTDWDYSNYGFVLLGRIIEATSGQSYYAYVRDHIFKLVGMNSTDTLAEEDHVPKLAIGYTGPGGPSLRLIGPGPRPGQDTGNGNSGLHIISPDSGAQPGPGGPGLYTIGPRPDSEKGQSASGEPLRPVVAGRGTSAGGGYSTVGDFLKFANALNSHKLLNAHYTELLTTGKVGTRRPGAKYAFGFYDETGKAGVRCIGHGGGSAGMNGRLSIFPDSRYVVVVLANFDPPAADSMAQFIREQLPLK
jgi:CubicO group peptidase (beta-lactamase class C family)